MLQTPRGSAIWLRFTRQQKEEKPSKLQPPKPAVKLLLSSFPTVSPELLSVTGSQLQTETQILIQPLILQLNLLPRFFRFFS